MSDRREELCGWLRANGVDPNRVPIEADMTVETDDAGARVLRCEVFVTDANGQRMLDERRTGIALEAVTVPLVAEPPAWWQPYAKPTREQLLDAVTAVHQVHRAAKHKGQIICVECSAYDGWTTTGNPPVQHPCDTIKALGTLGSAQPPTVGQQVEEAAGQTG